MTRRSWFLKFSEYSPEANSPEANSAPWMPPMGWCLLSLGLTCLAPHATQAAPPSHAAAPTHRTENAQRFVPGRVLIEPRAGLPEHALTRLLKEHQGQARRMGQSNLFIVDVPQGNEQGVVDKLKHHPHLKFAELDPYLEGAWVPNDPYYGSAWHLPKIGAPAAWDNAQGNGVTIAILDTGVESTHPDLASRIVPGWNFYDNNSNTADVQGHGTAVAGAAGASTNNTAGVSAISGQTKIMPVRVASPNVTVTGSAIAQGLTYAADHGARVANVSYANVPASTTVQSAAQYMKNKNGLVVVAAGNNGIDEGFAPTSTMIPVSATDANDLKTPWSSYGNYVMVAAPGIDIWTTFRNASYGTAWGTSLASPVTAGVIALMMSANPTLSSTQIEQLLFSTAVDLGAAGKDSYYGYGRVNAAAAVQAALNAAPAVDTQAPTISITSPSNSATVSGLVPVNLSASDNVGVTRVELRVNGTTVALDTSSPFAFSWDSTGVANGTATLVAHAFDAAGNTTASSPVAVNVANVTPPPPSADTTAPTVKIVSPVAGSVSGSVNITINASDNSGAAGIQLALYIDGALKASGTGSTLSTNWNTKSKSVKAGSHTIQVVAKDAAGNASSASVTVNVVK